MSAELKPWGWQDWACIGLVTTGIVIVVVVMVMFR